MESLSYLDIITNSFEERYKYFCDLAALENNAYLQKKSELTNKYSTTICQDEKNIKKNSNSNESFQTEQINLKIKIKKFEEWIADCLKEIDNEIENIISTRKLSEDICTNPPSK